MIQRHLLTPLIFLMGVGSAQALTIPASYRSGREICAENKSTSERAREHDIWLRVPIDHSHPSAGETDLFAWTHKPFDPTKKTVVIVAGGPGNTSHGSNLDLDDWNVVFFDQRGNSCSRPASRDLFLSRSFYSSTNTARDIDEIRKALRIDEISVYGASYGTAPAHLYGHHFPGRTRAVVLEGVIETGDSTLIAPSRRRKILQEFFDSLPGTTQDRILELSQRPGVPANWFSTVGMMMLYNDDPLKGFGHFLDSTIWSEDAFAAVTTMFQEQDPIEEEFGFGHVMMGMIGCQELGMNLSGISFYDRFEGRRLVTDGVNQQQKRYCEPLGFTLADGNRPYHAEDRPSLVPITYFQGGFDGATVSPGAIRHFKSAAKGFAQLLLARKGGHTPIQYALASGYGKGAEVDVRLAVLRRALNGEKVGDTELRALNQVTDLEWVMTSRSGPSPHSADQAAGLFEVPQFAVPSGSLPPNPVLKRGRKSEQ